MIETPREIVLHGALAQQFGAAHRFVAASAAEAVRALCAMVPGFRVALAEGHYRVLAADEALAEDALTLPLPAAAPLHVVPVVGGSGGRGGLLSIIAGVAILAAAFMTGGASLGASGLMFSGTLGAVSFGVGAALLVGGVATLAMKPPKGLASVDSPDNGASYNFNGPVNTTAEGNPVPLFYGEAMVGSAVLAADVYSEDQQ